MMRFMMSQQLKLLAKTVHTCAACIWIGGGFAVLVLLNNGSQANNGDELFAFNHAIISIDVFLIRPAAAVSLVSGTFLCIKSRWGSTKSRWIIFKWVVTITAIVFGLFYLDPCMKELASWSDIYRNQTVRDSTYQHILHEGVFAGYIQSAALLLLVLVSIFKPSFGFVETRNTAHWYSSMGQIKFIRNICGKKAYMGRH